jgi:hypothetical protein
MHLLVIPVVLGLVVYFLPTMVGFRKRNAGAIFALNLLLGWTLVGWVVSLVWALTKEDPPNSIVVQPLSVQVPQGWTCSTCRAPVAQGYAFCRNCGTKIGWPT